MCLTPADLCCEGFNHYVRGDLLDAISLVRASVNDTSIRGIRLIYLQTPLCGSCPKLPSFATLSKFLPCCVHPD